MMLKYSMKYINILKLKISIYTKNMRKFKILPRENTNELTNKSISSIAKEENNDGFFSLSILHSNSFFSLEKSHFIS